MRSRPLLLRHPVNEDQQAGQDHLVPVSLFKHKAQQCPFGYSLAPGKRHTVGWKPCICTPVRKQRRRAGVWVIS